MSRVDVSRVVPILKARSLLAIMLVASALLVVALATRGGERKAEEVEEEFVGKAGEAGPLVVRVHSLYRASKVAGKKPREDHVFLVVNISVENRGDRSIEVRSGDLLLVADGAEYTPSPITIQVGGAFRGGAVEPGESVSGRVVFEIPVGAKPIKLLCILPGLEASIELGG
ncbi:MAG: hypothetical protein DRN99_04560 [Thermoproteota archaeon]|nr:MAG: hypothetical protein DRN99_04560 [Candidatus Korarchaeota archaeon]